MQTTNQRIEMLKERTKRCCCKYCGGELKLRRIIYGDIDNARIEIFCSECDRIEYGVEKEIYQAARYFTEEIGFNAYPELDESEVIKKMNIAKVCEIIEWGCKNLNLLNAEGFKYPVYFDADLNNETLRLEAKKIDDLLAERELR